MMKIGRNEPCPCGSGKRYKHCHGDLSEARWSGAVADRVAEKCPFDASLQALSSDNRLVELELDRYVQMSARIPGWTRNAEAEELARISFSLPAECIIVEIGSFFGAGAVLLAGPRRMRGSGKVHCVDPFDGSGDSFSIPHYQRILAAHGGGSLRNHFDKNMKWAGLNEWVEVHQGYASDVAANWMTPVDLLFLDGDQSRSGARAAYDSWSPFLKQGGIIAIHNSNPGPRGVDHDGHLALVTEAIVSPKYDDIRLVQSTTFARKAAP